MNRIAFLLSVLLVGCAADGSNFIQRSNVLDKNAKGITIEHSKTGKSIAFKTASNHCTDLSKAAVFGGSSQQYGPDSISTWKCE